MASFGGRSLGNVAITTAWMGGGRAADFDALPRKSMIRQSTSEQAAAMPAM